MTVLTDDLRVRARFGRASWMIAVLVGFATALQPWGTMIVVALAMAIAGGGALAYFVWLGRRQGAVIRRPTPVNTTRLRTVAVLVFALIWGAAAALLFALTLLVIHAPSGMVLVVAVAWGSIGGEIMGRMNRSIP